MQINVVFDDGDHFNSNAKIELWNDICSLLDHYDCDVIITFSDVCSDMRK